jgi:hypothetical protein
MSDKNITSLMREALDTNKVDAWGNGFWTITQEELERFAKYIEMATLIDIEKRIEELIRKSDPMTQAGATAVLRELRGEK